MLQLLPFYSRFASIMSTYFPEIGQELVALLAEEFSSIQAMKESISPQNKVRNIRFIGELTKFSLFSTSQALDCLKACLDNFIGTNIDMVSNFLEVCGPFLVNSLDETVVLRINNLLDYMWRLKEKETISSMQTNSLEAAYYACRPDKNAQNTFNKGNVSTLTIE